MTAAISQQSVFMTKLLESHSALVKAVNGGGAAPGAAAKPKKQTKKHPSLGVIRLDYDYPPAEGDIDCPASYGYDILYKVCPGLTFEMAQGGHFSDEVEREFASCIKYLE